MSLFAYVLLVIAGFVVCAGIADFLIDRLWGWAPTAGAKNGKNIDDVLDSADMAAARILLSRPLTSYEVTPAMHAAHRAFERRERWLKRRRLIRCQLAQFFNRVRITIRNAF